MFVLELTQMGKGVPNERSNEWLNFNTGLPAKRDPMRLLNLPEGVIDAVSRPMLLWRCDSHCTCCCPL